MRKSWTWHGTTKFLLVLYSFPKRCVRVQKCEMGTTSLSRFFLQVFVTFPYLICPIVYLYSKNADRMFSPCHIYLFPSNAKKYTRKPFVLVYNAPWTGKSREHLVPRAISVTTRATKGNATYARDTKIEKLWRDNGWGNRLTKKPVHCKFLSTWVQ